MQTPPPPPPAKPFLVGRLANLLHFSAVPDPTFHFKAGEYPAFRSKAVPDPNSAHKMMLQALHGSIESVHGLPWLHFEPLKLLNSN
jgi:hypothetical protein